MSSPVPGTSRWILSAAVLASGVVIGALVFGSFFYAARAKTHTIQVVGSASERFQSDIAKWRLTLARQVGDFELAQGYAALRADLERVVSHIRAAGIDSSAISVQPVNSHPYWGREGVREGYNLTQSLYVVSNNPASLEKLALNPGDMLGSGVALEQSYLEYYYSGIAEVKRSLLAEATEDARLRAAEIAGGEDRLGGMISGRAGVFQITEPYSTEVSGGGIYSTATKEKEISVTVHATFDGE